MAKHPKGYTLIELIVVVVLLSIVFSFIAPKFRDAVMNDALENVKSKMMFRINELRSQALLEQKAFFLTFDLEKNEYWIEVEGGNARKQNSFFIQDTDLTDNYKINIEPLPPGVRVMDVWIKGNGKQASGTTSIKFSKEGYSQQAAIHLESEDGRNYTIVVRPFLPKAKIIDDYIEFVDT